MLVPAGGRVGLAEDPPFRLTIKAGAAREILLAFSPDSKTLAFTDKSAVIFWDLVENKKRGTLDKREPFEALWFMAFSPDGSTLGLGESDGILLWDVAAGKARNRIGQDVFVYAYAVAFAPDGKTLAIVGAGKDAGPQKIMHKIILWDFARREERAEISGNLGDSGVVLAPDLKTLAFCRLREDFLISVVDLDRLLDDKRRAVLPSGKYLTDGRLICFDPDGKILACEGSRGRIILWNVKTR
ncbi:MAG TPA: WD40 repeat domain-containing protein, partial [Gemmataceae bacterium]